MKLFKRRSLILVLFMLFFYTGCTAEMTLTEQADEQAEQTEQTNAPMLVAPPVAERKLIVKHIDGEAFAYLLQQAKDYSLLSNPETSVTAGVIPHHLTAAPFIGGFFTSLASSGAAYDAVVLIGPNHVSNSGDVVMSLRDWDFDGGVACETTLANQIKNIKLTSSVITENDTRMEDDHAVSTFIPFIRNFWPKAQVVPLLISRALSYDDTVHFAQSLYSIVDEYNGRVLLLCSIDFSHYLTPREAAVYDEETMTAINKKDCHAIHAFSNANLDSPSSLIIFLQYLDLQGAALTVLDHADASHFIGSNIEETTSYFVLTASLPSIP